MHSVSRNPGSNFRFSKCFACFLAIRDVVAPILGDVLVLSSSANSTNQAPVRDINYYELEDNLFSPTYRCDNTSSSALHRLSNCLLEEKFFSKHSDSYHSSSNYLQ